MNKKTNKHKAKKPNNKKAFTMVELLFVIIIIELIAAVVVSNMRSGKDAATLTAMQTDLKHTISKIQNVYQANQNYDKISGTYTDNNLDGFSDQKFYGKPLPMSKENVIKVQSWDCNTNSKCNNNNCQGYHITITNNTVNKKLFFNSCTKTKPSILNN